MTNKREVFAEHVRVMIDELDAFLTTRQVPPAVAAAVMLSVLAQIASEAQDPKTCLEAFERQLRQIYKTLTRN